MSRRCGSAIALNVSDVVAARATSATLFSHMGKRQARPSTTRWRRRLSVENLTASVVEGGSASRIRGMNADPAVTAAFAAAAGHEPPFGDDELSRIEGLTVVHARALEALNACSGLRRLTLVGCEVDERADLGGLRELRELRIVGCRMRSLLPFLDCDELEVRDLVLTGGDEVGVDRFVRRYPDVAPRTERGDVLDRRAGEYGLLVPYAWQLRAKLARWSLFGNRPAVRLASIPDAVWAIGLASANDADDQNESATTRTRA
jgi:hypothetical protein